MSNCVTEPKVASLLPDYARNAHGNLAEQNRMVGAQHGAQTTAPEARPGTHAVQSAQVAAAAVAAKPEAGAGADSKAAFALASKYSCTACHGVNQKIVGPAFTDIAKKYPGRADYIADKIKSGGTGVWGPVPMPPQTLSPAEAKTIASWIAGGAAK